MLPPRPFAVALAAACAALMILPGIARSQAWPQRTLPYVSDGSFPFAVAEAARAWNESGAGVTFRRVRAPRRALVAIRATAGRGCTGRAQVGYREGRRAPVTISRACADDVVTARLIAHELGHVLGLRHEPRRCSLMNPRAIDTAGDHCPAPVGGSWRCRVLEPVDLRRVAALYGGTPDAAGPATCPIWGALAPPAGFVVVSRPPGTEVVFAPPALTKLARLSIADPALSVVVARGGASGDCPASPVNVLARLPVEQGAAAARTLQLESSRPGPGRYCYVAWTTDSLGRTSPPSQPSVVSVGLPPLGERWISR